MLNGDKAVNISVYGFFHACVDFCCAAIVYSYIGKIDIEELFRMVIIYNALAFGLQPLVGFVSDKTGMARNYAIAGCGIIAFSFLFLKVPIIAVSLAAVGNAFFHVGGGSVILKISDGKSFLSGLFVAPGAIGLFLGAFLWKIPYFQLFWLSGLMVSGMIIISVLDEPAEIKTPFKFDGNKLLLWLTAFLILFSVAIRSFIGLTYDFSQKGHFMLMFLFVFGVAFGKAFGGWFADKFGMFNTSVAALLISLPLLFHAYNPFTEIFGILLFNFTMPVTLTALADMMPERKGFAFGLTTLFLLIGALPPLLYNIKITHTAVFVVIVSISIIATGIGLKIFEKVVKFSTENKND